MPRVGACNLPSQTDALAQPVTSTAGAQASTAQQPGASRILEPTLSTVAGELPLLHSRQILELKIHVRWSPLKLV